MHILEIPSFLPPYGGYFCIEQARALKARGHDVRVLHVQQLGMTVYPKHFFTAPYCRYWEKDGDVEIYRTNFRGIPHVVHQNMKRYCKIVNDMFDEYVARYGTPDIIHAHCCKWAGVAAYEISKRTDIPFFITEHMSRGVYERDFGEGWQKNTCVKTLLKESYEAACCVIPVAQELVETTTDFFGNNFRWVEVSNLIDTDFFRYKERKPLADRPFRFCCLANANGRWFYYKGYDVLLEAFKEISNAELHIAGRATTGKTMQDAIKASTNIVLHGELNKMQVRELLYDCDALVLASRSEVQPLVLLEAMSTGIPVVSTEVVPQSERIPGACIIVPVNDVAALHNAMKDVRNIHPSIETSRKIEALASPDVVAKKLEDIFTQQWKN